MTFIEFSEVLGNLGEFIGSVAVLVTLIYLAVQVRHSRDLLEENRRIALGQVSQTNAGFKFELQKYQAQPHLAQIRVKVEQGEAVYHEEERALFDQLNPVEKIQWRSIHAQFAIMLDDSLYQSSLGLVAEQDREILAQQVKSSMPYWVYFGIYIPTRLVHWHEQHKNDQRISSGPVGDS